MSHEAQGRRVVARWPHELVTTSPHDVTLVGPGGEAAKDQLLEKLWAQFTRRHDVRAYLTAREARMRMAWPAIERARLLSP